MKNHSKIWKKTALWVIAAIIMLQPVLSQPLLPEDVDEVYNSVIAESEAVRRSAPEPGLAAIAAVPAETRIEAGEARTAGKGEMVPEARIPRPEINIHARNVDSAMRQAAKEWLEDIAEEKAEASENYAASRNRFLASKETMAACTGGCDDEQAAYFSSARKYLLSVIEIMRLELEEVAVRIESSESLNATQVNESLSLINSYLSQLDALRDKVRSVSGAEGLREAATETSRLWKLSSMEVKRELHRSVGRKVGLMLKQADSLEERLACLQPSPGAVLQYSYLTGAAREFFEQGRNIWNNPGRSEDAGPLIMLSYRIVKAAHEVAEDALVNSSLEERKDCLTR